MSQLAVQFKQALQLYFSNPDDKDARNHLASLSYRVFKELVIDHNIVEADQYMPKIEEFLNSCSLGSIKISEEKSRKLAEFTRALTFSDNVNIRQSFHALNMAHNFHFNSSFISLPEEKIRIKLFYLQQAVTRLSDTTIKQVMNLTCERLTTLVDNHFSLSIAEQQKNYPVLLDAVGDIFLVSKKTIEREVLLKKVTYNLLAAIVGLGVFYGLYLATTASKRHGFFLNPEAFSVLQNATKEMSKVQEQLAAHEEPPRNEIERDVPQATI